MEDSVLPHYSTLLGRVLLLGNFLSAHGGSRGVCEDLALRLRGRGWEVSVASSQPQRVLRLLDMCLTVWRARKRYDVAQIDVFSGPAFLWAEAVVGVLRLLGKPSVLTLHGGNLPRFAQRWPGRVRRLLASAAAVTTPSRYLLEQMAPYRSGIILLPNALDLSQYHPRPLAQPVYPRLIWLRAFHRIYNPVLAAQVIDRLCHEWPDIHLTMVGPDKGDGIFQEFERFVADRGLGAHVTCVGGVPKAEVSAWLQRGDIFLNTTNVDNTPVSVIEAMACGRCVVSTNVGGIPYLLEHETDALLVPPDDPDAMADAVRRTLTEPELAENLSRNARRKAEQFDWETILPQWERLLTEVAQRG
ncbi:MAG: glycosyltransferase family 4 protein [Chloroflexota bacterium]|jgi:glycosyltransferase involved in cell wall biosynthesis